MSGIEEEFERLARSEPTAALSQLPQVLDQLGGTADAAASGRVLRHAALAARSTRDLELSQKLIDRALAIARANDDREGIVLHNLTKAYNHFLVGDQELAIELVAGLDGGSNAQLQTMIDVQHATILGRSGRNREAIETLDSALARTGPDDDQYVRSQIYKNRGMFLARDGRYEESVADARSALEICDRLGLEFEVAFCNHNIGLAASYAGDLPEAFAHFSVSERRMRELAGSDFEAKAGHCKALLAAGLFTEAATMADEAAAACQAADYLIDGAETWLVAASAWLEAGELDRAVDRAERARSAFSAQDRPGWAAAAELIPIATKLRSGASLDPRDLDDPIARLENAGLRRDLVEARLLQIEAATTTGEVEAARTLLEDIQGETHQTSTDLHLALLTTAALLCDVENDVSGAERAANDGYRLLAEQQAVLGASDLRIGLRRHAERLGRIGLGASLQQTDPTPTTEWIERLNLTRATPLPVRPARDPALRSALAELRALEAENRQQRADLEERVLALDRSRRGSDRPILPYAPDHLAEELTDRVGVTIAGHDGVLIAAIVTSEGQSLKTLGPADKLARLHRSLRADLRRRALTPDRAKRSRIDRALRAIDEIFAPLDLDGEPAVLCPPTNSFSIPWASLPSRVGRPTEVTSSLTSWSAARRPQADRRIAFIAGPDLDFADDEIERLAGPSDLVLRSSESTVDKALDLLEGSSVAHIVAHGQARTDNPLFSGLRLADGELNAYEIGDLVRPPEIVVLSACHLGLPAEAAGHELLGMVTGLLTTGTRCVVASALPVPDHRSTIELMTRLHRFLADGLAPAAAWAEVQRTCADDEQLLDTASFSVFGRG